MSGRHPNPDGTLPICGDLRLILCSPRALSDTLTHLTPEILSTLLPLLFSTPQALASLTSLTIDLVTEQGPAIALAYEGPERDIMRVPPRNMKVSRLTDITTLFTYCCCLLLLTHDMKTERLVTVRSLTYAYLTMGLFQFAVCFMTFLWVYGDVRSLPPYWCGGLTLVESAILSGGCKCLSRL